MTKLTGNQMAVVIAAERAMLLTSGRPTVAEPPKPVVPTDEQLAAMALEDQRREVVQLRFGGTA